jgi:CRISPR system Cascade subunit CasD
VDYQTVHTKKYWEDVSNGNVPNGNCSYISPRYYLADAVFAVGLEGDKELLEKIEYALKHPYFPLYLGRKSCPPAGKVVIGIKDGDLVTAIRNYQDENMTDGERILIEAENGGYSVKDTPLTFNRIHRKYTSRQVKNIFLSEHDAFGETEV